MKTAKNQFIVLAGFLDCSKGAPFENMKIKVVRMISNFERLHEILNQENSENFSFLSHVEPKFHQNAPNQGQDDLVHMMLKFIKGNSTILECKLSQKFLMSWNIKKKSTFYTVFHIYLIYEQNLNPSLHWHWKRLVIGCMITLSHEISI